MMMAHLPTVMAVRFSGSAIRHAIGLLNVNAVCLQFPKICGAPCTEASPHICIFASLTINSHHTLARGVKRFLISSDRRFLCCNVSLWVCRQAPSTFSTRKSWALCQIRSSYAFPSGPNSGLTHWCTYRHVSSNPLLDVFTQSMSQ